MKKFYTRTELGFALVCIGVYVVGMSIFEELSKKLGIENLAAALFALVLSALLFVFLKKNKLLKYYGIGRAEVSASRFLYYIPLIVLTSANLWNPFGMQFGAEETVFFVIKMLCVGFLEELIFRGFLFKAMCRDSVKWAIAVSSVTFGLGHILNLINGSGMQLGENLFQIVTAVMFGFLYVLIFHRGGSLLPCIISHGIFNCFSGFSVEVPATQWRTRIGMCALVLVYTAVLLKTLPKKTDASGI